jgi:F0F1-type ATP synthase beta subunit
MARQVATLFCQQMSAEAAVKRAAKLERFASELLATAELFAETPGEWSVSPTGQIHAKDPKLEQEYTEHRASLTEATELIGD